MHGMKKKRVPREITNPIIEAIRGCQPIRGKDLEDLRRVEGKALDALANGTATKRDWERIAEVFNIAECMARDGLGIELIPITAQAQVYLCEAFVKSKESGQWHLGPVAVWHLREGVEYHDLQRQSVPLSEYRRYLKRVTDIRRTGANALPPDKLLERARGL